MRSKWYRSIVAVTLVAAFAAGTVAVSGGYQPFQIGATSGNPLQGMDIARIADPATATPYVVGRLVLWGLGALATGYLGKAGADLYDRIRPFRNPTDSMSLRALGESIFDPS